MKKNIVFLICGMTLISVEVFSQPLVINYSANSETIIFMDNTLVYKTGGITKFFVEKDSTYFFHIYNDVQNRIIFLNKDRELFSNTIGDYDNLVHINSEISLVYRSKLNLDDDGDANLFIVKNKDFQIVRSCILSENIYSVFFNDENIFVIFKRSNQESFYDSLFIKKYDMNLSKSEIVYTGLGLQAFMSINKNSICVIGPNKKIKLIKLNPNSHELNNYIYKYPNNHYFLYDLTIDKIVDLELRYEQRDGLILDVLQE
jgi:hypothetical protein